MAQPLLYHCCVHTYSGRTRHTYINTQPEAPLYQYKKQTGVFISKRDYIKPPYMYQSAMHTRLYIHLYTHKHTKCVVSVRSVTEALKHSFTQEVHTGLWMTTTRASMMPYTTVQGHSEEKCVQTHKRCVHTQTHTL